MQKRKFLFLLFILLPWIFFGCGEIVPVWVGEVELKEYELHYTDGPQEFEISLDIPVPNPDLRLELEVTYQIGGVGRNDLPLMLMLEGKNISPPKEFPVVIPLKNAGEWAGETKENKVDKIITFIAIPSISLESGEYLLKIYANDEKEEKIHGIIRLVSRLYLNEEEEE